MIDIKLEGDPTEYDNRITVGSQVYIPKGNAGKGAFGTISHIVDSEWQSLYFCEEYDEALYLDEIVPMNQIFSKHQVSCIIKDIYKDSEKKEFFINLLRKFS